MYPASITKVLTAVVTMENCQLTDVATVSKEAIDGVEFGYVTANLKEGEELTIEQLLNILIVSSANDAALVLAEHISGSVKDFAVLMNQTATKIGCTNSNFVNPNGAHDENHYSTAHDLALIGNYALKFDFLKELFDKTYYRLPATNAYDSDNRVYTTTNDLLISSSSNYYKYANGMKTGFTTPAGNCLMASATKNGLTLISVVLNSSSSDNRYLETKKLFDYGFDNFSLKKFISKGDCIQTVSAKWATKDTKKLNLVVDNDIYVTVSNDLDISTIKSEDKITAKIKAPIEKGEKMGTVSYTVNGITYEANLVAENAVKNSHLLLKFTITFTVLFLVLILYKIRKANLKKKRIKMIKKL